MYQDILSRIDNSEMILVGIGNELASYKPIDWNTYKIGKKQHNDLSNEAHCEWKELFSEDKEKCRDDIHIFYQVLNKILDKKNFFIITTNVDDFIYESELNPVRIVAPCGSKNRLQCRCEGEAGIIQAPEDFYLSEGDYRCEKCQSSYEPNIYNKIYYNETGYLKQWNLYNKWLQGTLNKKLLILEFGCDFSLLSLIRLPFEKIALINQKAVYYRINGKYPQVTAELKDKMISVACTPQEFAKQIREL